MIARSSNDTAQFTISRASFDRWCDDQLRDSYYHRLLAVDKDRSWPRFKAQVEQGMRRTLGGTDWTLIEGDDDNGEANSQDLAIFLTVVRQTRRNWPTWRVEPFPLPETDG